MPLLKVRSEIEVGVRIWNSPLEPPPLIVRFDMPRPTIVRLPVLSLIVIGDARVIVLSIRLLSKVMLSLPGLVAA